MAKKYGSMIKLASEVTDTDLYISSSIYSGSVPSTPYTKNEKGHGPAWANSLFEDFCEFGLGMELAKGF